MRSPKKIKTIIQFNNIIGRYNIVIIRKRGAEYLN